MTRAVGQSTITDRVTGALLPTALVTVVQADGSTPVTFDFWTGTGGRTASSPSANPFPVSDGKILIYTAQGQIMTLLVDVSGHARATVQDFETEVPFGPSVTNAPVAGYVLMATDATHVAWAEPTGGASVVNPGDPSTVPSVIYIKDNTNVVWGITIATSGALTTTTYAAPQPVQAVTIEDSTNPGGVSFTVTDFDTSDTFALTYANQGYLGSTPGDLDYNDIGVFNSSHFTTTQGLGTTAVTIPSITGIIVDNDDFGSHILHVRVVHTKGGQTSAYAQGTLQGAQFLLVPNS
jgi:hypothetical protein